VLRSRRRTPLPRPGQVVLPRELARTWSIVDGGTVTLAAAAGGHSVRLRATVASEVDTARLTGADLGPLAPHAAVSQLWLRLSDPSSPSDLGNVSDVVSAAAPTAQVSGVAAERTAINRVLDVLLLVVTALLAVAVLIAMIGVGNTLALSVVERRQETGLLRALGLTRRQLRRLSPGRPVWSPASPRCSVSCSAGPTGWPAPQPCSAGAPAWCCPCPGCRSSPSS